MNIASLIPFLNQIKHRDIMKPVRKESSHWNGIDINMSLTRMLLTSSETSGIDFLLGRMSGMLSMLL